MASLLQRVQPISWMRVVSKRREALFLAGAINSPRRLFGTNIKVILKDDVPGTGYRGEYVEVKAGFMRNYLFPKKRAMYATEENTFLYESVDRTGEKERAVALKAMKRGRKEMAGVTIIMKRYLPTDETRLDHAVTAKHVCSYLRKNWQFKGTEKDVRMPKESPIESLGKHAVMVRIALPEAVVPILQEELGVKEFEKQAWVEMTVNIEKTTTKVKEQLEDAEEIVEEGGAGEEGAEEARGNEQEKNEGVSSRDKS